MRFWTHDFGARQGSVGGLGRIERRTTPRFFIAALFPAKPAPPFSAQARENLGKHSKCRDF